MKVSDPRSPHYGQHWTMDDLSVFANPEGTALVHKFLANFDVKSVSTSTHGEYVKAWMTVETANKLLSTTFHEFVSKKDGKTSIVRCGRYELPAELAAEVSLIGYTTHFPVISTLSVFRALRMDADGQATPKVISSYYKIGNNNPSSCSENPNNCVEAELDVQVITAIAQDTHTTFWSVPGSESFLEWAQAVASDSNPPKVFSISYGAVESEIPSSQAQSFDAEAAKLGLRGVSIFVALVMMVWLARVPV